MAIRLGIVMDPVAAINVDKDSTLSMLWEAQARGWEIFYFELKHLFLRDGIPYGEARPLTVARDLTHWYQLGHVQDLSLSNLDVILMRKDPPFNEEYIYATHLLEYAERLGVLVANKPQSLRDANEKMFAAWFPQCCPPTLVTRQVSRLKAFWHEHGDIVCKPLHGMGGEAIFHLSPHEVNANVIFDMLTHTEARYIMAQKFIPAVKQGDKRILLVNGEPIPYALVRVPQGDEWRGNLAVGAKGMAKPLSARDYWICAQVGPVLREKGLYFVGLDVIGEYLTEINVTSPTGIRELDAQCGLNIAGRLLDCIEAMISVHDKNNFMSS
ncbi:MAG: glutathione synthase [Gammaproteobacteria bacterium RIFCSPHIGHO2_12_FULL_41_20]|nr:MAG: glutathione synthase [Gammaproteobacteria bacterium RIFCSPHIGHO2_12_FULL_41_20]